MISVQKLKPKKSSKSHKPSKDVSAATGKVRGANSGVSVHLYECFAFLQILSPTQFCVGGLQIFRYLFPGAITVITDSGM